MAQFTILEENRGTDKNSASGQLSALFAAGGSLFPVGLNARVRVGGTESIYNRILRQSYSPCSASWTFVLPFLESPCCGSNLTPQHFSPLQEGRLEAEMFVCKLDSSWLVQGANQTAVGLLKAQGFRFKPPEVQRCLWYFSRAVSRGDPQAEISVIKLGFLLTFEGPDLAFGNMFHYY